MKILCKYNNPNNVSLGVPNNFDFGLELNKEYKEFVHPTQGVQGAGLQRIITGQGGEMWYTPDHYQSFIRIK